MEEIKKQDRATLTDVNGKVKRVVGKKRKERAATQTQTLTQPQTLTITGKGAEDGVLITPQPVKLRAQLKEATDLNENLNRKIAEKNAEIDKLRRSVQGLNDVLNSVPIDDVRSNNAAATNKILQLSKKNRILGAELEFTKLRLRQKDTLIVKMERDMKQMRDKNASMQKPVSSSSIGDMLEHKLSAMQLKLFETRNRNLELQAQLKTAHKFLQQEIGTEFDAHALTTGTLKSNWRGRAQQILLLQRRIKELSMRLLPERLSAGLSPDPKNALPGSDVNGSEEATKVTASDSKSSNQVQAVAPVNGVTSPVRYNPFIPTVRHSEFLHHTKVDSLEKCITTLNEQIKEQQFKISALKVRNRTLMDELDKLRTKNPTSEDNIDNMQNLSVVLQQMDQQQREYELKMADLKANLQQMQVEQQQTAAERDQCKLELQTLKQQLAKQTESMHELAKQRDKFEADLKNWCGNFLFSCRDLKKEEFITILDALETEKNMLLQHVKVLKTRIDEERQRNQQLHEEIANQKNIILQLENEISEQKLNLNLCAAQKERVERAAAYSKRVSSNSSLGSFVFENSSTILEQQSQSRLCTRVLENELESYKLKLQTNKETIERLQAKIDNLNDEKEKDCTAFGNIIGCSKNLILETLLNHQNNAVCDVKVALSRPTVINS